MLPRLDRCPQHLPVSDTEIQSEVLTTKSLSDQLWSFSNKFSFHSLEKKHHSLQPGFISPLVWPLCTWLTLHASVWYLCVRRLTSWVLNPWTRFGVMCLFLRCAWVFSDDCQNFKVITWQKKVEFCLRGMEIFLARPRDLMLGFSLLSQ